MQFRTLLLSALAAASASAAAVANHPVSSSFETVTTTHGNFPDASPVPNPTDPSITAILVGDYPPDYSSPFPSPTDPSMSIIFVDDYPTDYSSPLPSPTNSDMPIVWTDDEWEAGDDSPSEPGWRLGKLPAEFWDALKDYARAWAKKNQKNEYKAPTE